MIKNPDGAELLKEKGLKRTKVRMAMIRHFIKMEHAQSYNDLQAALYQEVDKSTLYRNLSSFEQAGIIHRINDHSGISKYALGQSPLPGREHAHFVCESCETVYCVKASAAYRPEVPKGFRTSEVQTIIKGVCPRCINDLPTN